MSWRTANEFSRRDACAKEELLQSPHLLTPMEGYEFVRNRPLNAAQQSPKIPNADRQGAYYERRFGHLINDTEYLP